MSLTILWFPYCFLDCIFFISPRWQTFANRSYLSWDLNYILILWWFSRIATKHLCFSVCTMMILFQIFHWALIFVTSCHTHDSKFPLYSFYYPWLYTAQSNVVSISPLESQKLLQIKGHYLELKYLADGTVPWVTPQEEMELLRGATRRGIRGCNPCPFCGRSYLCPVSDSFLSSFPKAT